MSDEHRRRLTESVSFEVVEARHHDAQEAMTSYFAELDARFPGGFDPGDAVTAGAPALSPPHGVFVLARHDTTTVGCGGVQRVDDDTGEIKRMWIHPEWRGLGLGKRLLVALEDHVRRLGFGWVVLDTNGELSEAIALYESAGYRATDPYNDNPYAQRWFVKEL